MSAAGSRTTGPHFFVEPGLLDADGVVLRGDEARHLTLVLRARPGDQVSLADGRGKLYQAEISGLRGDAVRLRVTAVHDLRPPRPRLSVVHALPKGRKLDEVVQRLTELGVNRIVPVHSGRSQVRLSPDKAAKAVGRWRAVSLAAAKQSRRATLPRIEQVGDWASAFPPGGRGIVLWECSRRPLRTALAAVAGPPGAAMVQAEDFVLAVGPEGGLSAEEVSACALVDASLGPTVLRTETAALVAASAVAYHLGRLG